MTEAAAILEVRHVRLADQATLQPAALGPASEAAEEGVFIALDDPPPVRTVLAVVEGGRRRALEVAWVVEVPDPGSPRGFHGRWVSDEALERAARVGTEHLEDGTPVVQPVVPDHSAAMDVSDASMAMPAPVMIVDDDTGVVDVSDDGEGEPAAEAEAAAEAVPAREGSDASHASNDDEVDDSADERSGESEAAPAATDEVEGDGGDSRRGRKKRGRRRR